MLLFHICFNNYRYGQNLSPWKEKEMKRCSVILVSLLLCAAFSQADAIWDTRSEFDADFSNTANAFASDTLISRTSAHGYIQYSGTEDFVTTEHTFEYNFTFGDGATATGGGFWIGNINFAQWLFFGQSSTEARLRLFNGRNISSASGGSVVVDRINNDFVAGETYTLIVEHGIGTGNNKILTVDMVDESRNSVLNGGGFTYAYAISGIEAWGITTYGDPNWGEVTNSLSATAAVPEPVTMSLLLMGIPAFILKRRK